MGKITFKINNGGKMTLEQYDYDGAVEFTTEFPKRGDITEYDASFNISPADFVMLMNSFEHFKRTGEWLTWEVQQ